MEAGIVIMLSNVWSPRPTMNRPSCTVTETALVGSLPWLLEPSLLHTESPLTTVSMMANLNPPLPVKLVP